MPMIMGMVSSHFPSLFQDTFAGWERYWRLLSDGIPQPPEVALENEPCIEDWIRRKRAAFDRLRASFTSHRPDALIVVAGDQDEWFSATHLPGVLVYSGTAPIKGFHNYGDFDSDPPLKFWEHPDRFGITVDVDSALAAVLQSELVQQGFDVSISRSIRPRGRPERLAPHALTRPLP